MKPRLFTSILMFISAYSPLFLIFAVRDVDFDKSHWFKHPVFIFIMLGVTALSIVLLFIVLAMIDRGTMAVRITSIKNRSVDLFNYSILYVICFFGIDPAKLGDVISIAIFLILMLWLTITTKSIFLNPILSLGGYGLYDIEYEFDGKPSSAVVLCRIEISESESFYIRNISRFLFLIIEKKTT